MIKRLIVFAAFAAIALSMNAQLQVGVKGGLNYSTVTASTYTNTMGVTIDGLGYKPSYFAGLAVRYMMGPFGIESGAYYSVLGGKASDSKGAYEYKVSTDPAYIQAPLLFLFKFQATKKSYFYPSLGVNFSYGVGGKIKQENIMNGDIIKETNDDYFSDATKKFDIMPTVSLNYEFNKFVVGLGYEYGIRRVNEKKVKDGKNMHNNNFKLSIGYMF